jgi:hypothetical protein
MRAALVVVVALALVGCDKPIFDPKSPEGYTCAATGTPCPPGQQCVPGEHVCRTPCTQTAVFGGGGGPVGTNGQCTNINQNSCDNGNCTSYNCDYDHFCRPGCNGVNAGSCGGCTGTDVCDTSVNICRPSCVGGCATDWGCADFSSTANATGGICLGCRPLATSTLLPPKFADPVFYDAGNDASEAVVVGNLAGPGPASIVAVNMESNRISVYASDASGVLAAPVQYANGLPSPRSVVVLDLTRDGNLDVVVGTVTSPMGGPVLLPGNGDGTLGAAIAGPRGPAVHLATGDFDRDGKLDVVGCGGYNELAITTSDGMGGMTTLTTVTSGAAQFIRLGAADLNADGKLDLWADDKVGSIDSFLNNGAKPPGFPMGMNSSFGTRADELSFDVDGDNKADLILSESMPGGPTGMQSGLLVAKGNGTGGFMTSASQITLPAVGQLASADFDGDGHLDVALLEAQTGGKSSIDILNGDGSSLVYSEILAIGKDMPQSIAAGDVDGDGKPDLVIGLANGVAVLINQTPSR